MKFILLASLLALARSSATTITVTVSDSAAASASPAAPSAAEVTLVRNTYPLIKSKSVLVGVVTELLKTHPKVQELLPEQFASLSLADLKSSADFNQQAYANMLLALNFIVDNLDNPSLLSAHLQRLSNYNNWHVDYVDEQRQLAETVRIFSSVISEQLGSQLPAEAQAAWSKGLSYALSFMGRASSTAASGKSALSAAELSAVRSAFNQIDLEFVENCMIKLFVLHPSVQNLNPSLAGVAVSELKGNEEFKLQAQVALRALHWIANNLDNDELLSVFLAKINSPSYYVDYVSVADQLDEATRVFVESAKGVLPSSTVAAIQKAFDHVATIMSAPASVAKRTSGCPGVPGDMKALIRNTWALARRNSNIAPKLFLKMFAAHPETQKLFPRFANVAKSELSTNQDFLQQSYNCLAGLTNIINHLDSPDLMATFLSTMSSPAYFVDGPSASEQLAETSRLLNEVMSEELASVYTAEVAAAFTTLFDHVSKTLAKANDNAAPTAADKQIVKDSMIAIKAQDGNIGSRMLIKLFQAHPDSQKLFAQFASVPLNDLPANAEFQAYSKVMNSGLNFIVENIDDSVLMKEMFSSKNVASYLVAGVSVRQQLEETVRIAVEAIGEELGARFTPATKRAFTRAFRANLSNV